MNDPTKTKKRTDALIKCVYAIKALLDSRQTCSLGAIERYRLETAMNEGRAALGKDCTVPK